MRPLSPLFSKEMLHLHRRLSGPSSLPIDSAKTVQEYNYWRYIANDGGEELVNRRHALEMMCAYLSTREGQEEIVARFESIVHQTKTLSPEDAHKLLDRTPFPVFVDTAVQYRSEISDALVDPITQVLQEIETVKGMCRGAYFQFLTGKSAVEQSDVIVEWDALEPKLINMALERLVVDAHEKLRAFMEKSGLGRTTKKQSMIPPPKRSDENGNGNGNGHTENSSREVSTASSN